MNNKIPTLDIVMMAVTTGVLVLAMILYVFAPESKAEQLVAMMTLAGGFLFGKFSNRFKPGQSQLEESVKQLQEELDKTHAVNAHLLQKLAGEADHKLTHLPHSPE